jgi:hypothetical protein
MLVIAEVLGVDAASWGVVIATVASAEASLRSAGAAETSAQHAERSASAAERSAAADERAVELDEQRAAHERRERADRDAPRWQPTGEDEAAFWISDDNHLDGVLVNVGRVAAHVTGAVLDLPTGGQIPGRFRRGRRGRRTADLPARSTCPRGRRCASPSRPPTAPSVTAWAPISARGS